MKVSRTALDEFVRIRDRIYRCAHRAACEPAPRYLKTKTPQNKNAARNWAAFGFEVQRSLKRTYRGIVKISILVAGVEPLDLAQQRRPDQHGRAKFLPVRVGEYGGVLVDHGLLDRIGSR